MARKTQLVSLKQISEINLTPLMDLTFILLITFIITFPLLEQGISVDLPEGDAGELEPEKAYTVTLDRDGNLYFDQRRVSAKVMKERLISVKALNPSASVMVRADKGIVYGKVINVLRILREAKITNMSLVTEPEKE